MGQAAEDLNEENRRWLYTAFHRRLKKIEGKSVMAEEGDVVDELQQLDKVEDRPTGSRLRRP